MATSGTYSWNLNRDQLFLMAYQEINVLGENDTTSTMSANQITYANNKLNGMLKMWSIDGIKVPKRKIAYLFTQLSQYQYILGSISGTDNCTNSYHSTTLTVNASSSATVLTVSSTSGMTMNDYIGIQLDDGTRQWTTISSVNSSTSVTIAAGLTTTSASGNSVVSYTTKINRPLDVLYGTRLDLTNNTESQVNSIGHDEYQLLPNKSLAGQVIDMHLDKQISGARPNASILYVYPNPSDVTKIVKFIYADQIQDLTSSSDDIDLPQEWLYPVMWNLAAELAYSYGKFQELQMIQPKATQMYELLKDASYDDEPIQFKLMVKR